MDNLKLFMKDRDELVEAALDFAQFAASEENDPVLKAERERALRRFVLCADRLNARWRAVVTV